MNNTVKFRLSLEYGKCTYKIQANLGPYYSRLCCINKLNVNNSQQIKPLSHKQLIS